MDPYMNSYLVSLIVIALYLAYALLLLLIRALIVRSDIYRRWAERTTHHSRPAPIKDLRTGHEPVIKMPFSEATRELLQRLAKNRAALARSAAPLYAGN
jgi:HAMP domain-containing protein